MNDYAKHHTLINRAKIALMSQKNTTFYSTFVSLLKVTISDQVATAGTDGIQIIYNPDFLDNLTPDEILGLTLHEVEHVVNQHVTIWKEHNLCPDIHNIACDHYINLRLLALGYKLPGNDYYADKKYTGWSSMMIYHDLMKDAPAPKPELMDIMAPPDNMTPEELNERVTNNVLKAIVIAESSNDAGSVPGHLRRELDDRLSPKLPWHSILANYLTEYVDEDYSMRRPNRRYMPGWYLPTLQGEGLGHIMEACDVSASMHDDDVSEIWSEFRYIAETMSPMTCHVMTFDTQVHLDKTYKQGEPIKEFTLKGGGGTNVQPFLDAVRDENPVFALIFTDGYFGTPNMDGIESDIFWIIKGNPQFTAPKGIVIPFE